MKVTKEQAATLLGIDVATTNEEEINRAFRKASLKCHPDKTLHLNEAQQKEACKYIPSTKLLWWFVYTSV